MRFSTSTVHLGRFLLSLIIVAGSIGFVPRAQAQDQGQGSPRQFDRLSASSGWVLLDQKLFRTSDAGETWQEISPSLPSDALVQDVHFIDADTGWVLFTTPASAGGALFHLANTTDGGITWGTRTLSLFEAGEIASYAERSETHWFDSQHGWISVKQTSGSNFSLGTLFITTDGGDTWKRSSLPIADTIYFSDPEHGWAIGGPTGDQVFVTSDAGESWQNVSPEHTEDVQANVYTPFVSNGEGLLAATNVGAADRVNLYRLENSGTWSLFDEVPLNTQPGLIGLSILDAWNFVATIPGTTALLRMVDGRVETIENQDGLSPSIVALDMISITNGWAKSTLSNCETVSASNAGSVSVNCTSTTRLLETSDGGLTWQSVLLPSGPSGALRPGTSSSTTHTTTMNSLSSLGNSLIYIGQGFDICEIPTLSQMQTWASSSPYKAVNLYIGGSSRLCGNAALTSAYLQQLSAQGWKFIPTWVGPQAPCTGYISRMSSDPATAYNQGVAQADLAVDTLANLGLTFSDKSGSVVYYDIEYYGTNTACRTAVNSFMNGWVAQIHARGNLAGIYSSPSCNTGLSDFRTITNVPDVVWIAAWYYNIGDPRGTYDPTASVWDYLGSCMPNTAWANHQRIRQYSGDHMETWGSLSMEIDNDILDGIVATPFVANPPIPVLIDPLLPRPRPVMQSLALTPTSLTTQSGTTNGSLSSLSLFDQAGTEDNPAAYVSFLSPDSGYVGVQTFQLPGDAQPMAISKALLQINYKGSGSPPQAWVWSIYDPTSDLWITLGDSLRVETGPWQSLVFRIPKLWRFISADHQIRIQVRSSRVVGTAKIDYEAIHITYLSDTVTPTITAPAVPSRRPGISSSSRTAR